MSKTYTCRHLEEESLRVVQEGDGYVVRNVRNHSPICDIKGETCPNLLFTEEEINQRHIECMLGHTLKKNDFVEVENARNMDREV